MRKAIIFTLAVLIQGCISQELTQENMFNPVKEYPLNKDLNFERHLVSNSDSTKIEIWILKEKDAKFNIIYASGNGTNIRSAVPLFNELSKQFDTNIYSFNYSGYGLSEGNPSIEGIVKDGQIALDFFENKISNNLPTIIIGYSLGGYVSLSLLNNDFIDKAVIMSTFTTSQELQDYLLKEALPGIVRPFLKLKIDESIYKLDNISLVRKNSKPILFIHGENDEFIPATMSTALYNESSANEKYIKLIKNADHRTVLKDTTLNKFVVSEIRDFIYN